MASMNCNLIKESLVGYIKRELEVSTFQNKCVITLPIKTFDDRFVDIVVEEKLSDYYLVHDAGKSLGELFAQGVSLTDTRRKLLGVIAHQFGAELSDGIFTVGCKHSGLQDAVFAISQCATLAMFELAEHRPIVEEEPIAQKISRSLKQWQPRYIREINRGVPMKGHLFPHKFDFVAFSEDESRHPTCALQNLPPTYSARVQAERYAFLVLDIRDTYFDRWPRLAVLSKIEQWTPDAKNMVSELSTNVLEVRSDEEGQIEETLPSFMNQLVA